MYLVEVGSAFFALNFTEFIGKKLDLKFISFIVAITFDLRLYLKLTKGAND